MNKVVREEIKKEAFFDLTPMIDCVFLLIIFFMCVTEMVNKEFESITLPKATQAIDDKNAPKHRQVINVTYAPPNELSPEVRSHIKIRGQVYDQQEKLVDYLKKKVAEFPNEKDEKGQSLVEVKIRADGRCEYQKVQRVMVACMKAGISRVSIGAEPKRGGG